MKKLKNGYPLVVIALILLFNPSANLIDVLPDCIAYILLILAIGASHETVPYLAECKGALVKLTLVTGIKIPAFVLMYTNIKSGKDIVPLFTLVFVILELILLYSAVNNGYNALRYLGERTDCASVRGTVKGGKIKCSLEQLRIFTFIFFAARGVLNVIPEIFLLTPEDISLRKRLTEAYPIILVLCIFTALIIGAAWLSYVVKYVRHVKGAKDLGNAVASIEHHGTPEEENENAMMKRLLSSLTLLAVSSLFIFDLTFSNFGEYNVLPHFIYGFLLFVSMYSLTKDKKLRTLLTVGTSGYTITSMIGYFLTVRFFDSFNYTSIKYSSSAKLMYNAIKLFSVFETLAALFMLTVSVMVIIDFVKQHTDVPPSDPSYSKTNEKNHKLTIRNALPIFIISAIVHIMKCANVFIKQSSTVLHSDASAEGITASGVPAMDTIIFLTCAVYVICCFVKASNLKDEVRFKYEKD